MKTKRRSVHRLPTPKPVVLALCEQDALILRPGVTYRFVAIPRCVKCNQILARLAE